MNVIEMKCLYGLLAGNNNVKILKSLKLLDLLDDYHLVQDVKMILIEIGFPVERINNFIEWLESGVSIRGNYFENNLIEFSTKPGTLGDPGLWRSEAYAYVKISPKFSFSWKSECTKAKMKIRKIEEKIEKAVQFDDKRHRNLFIEYNKDINVLKTFISRRC